MDEKKHIAEGKKILKQISNLIAEELVLRKKFDRWLNNGRRTNETNDRKVK